MLRPFRLPVLPLGIFCALALPAPVSGQSAAPLAARFAPLTSPPVDAAGVTRTVADEYLRAWMERFPSEASAMRLPGAPQDRLSDNSLDAERAWERVQDGWLTRLLRVDAAELADRAEWVTYGLLREELEAERGLRVCRRSLWNLNPVAPWFSRLAELAQGQPVGTPQARADALARFAMVHEYAEMEIAKLRRGVELGYVAQRNVVEATLLPLEALLATPVEWSPLYSPAARDSTPEFRAAFTRLVRDEVRPALRRYRDYLREEYLPQAREHPDLSALPDGAACYRAFLRRHTSLDLSPREINRTAREQFEREKEVVREFARDRFGSSDALAAVREAERRASSQIHSPEAVMEYSAAVVARARQIAPEWFSRLPRAELVVEPQPALQEMAGIPGFYQPASVDGAHPAVVWLSRNWAGSGQTFALHALALHEGIPGHHLQVGLAMERPLGHPVEKILVSTAFSEGWASYAEGLAYEMGLYPSEAAWLDQQLRNAWSTALLVSETGALALGWTREDAVGYLVEEAEMNERMAARAVDRSQEWPGQSVAYWFGKMEILRLREEAERRLGNRLDVREFHDRVLENGPIPFRMLREHIETWIAQQQSATTQTDPPH